MMIDRKIMLAELRHMAASHCQALSKEQPMQAVLLHRCVRQLLDVLENIEWTAASAREVSEKVDPIFGEIGLSTGHVLWIMGLMLVGEQPPPSEQLHPLLEEIMGTTGTNESEEPLCSVG